MKSVNVGKKLWDCRNYRNQMEEGYDFFKWLCNEIVDGRDLKIERQKKKLF